MDPLKVLLLAGGQSDEHEVSLVSARNVAAGLRLGGHEVAVRVITRAGLLLPAAESSEAVRRGHARSGGVPLLAALEAALAHADVVFAVLHGPNGEDGTVQGLLRLAGVPQVGSGVLGSALAMDKPMAKAVLHSHGLPQVAYALVLAHDMANDAAGTAQRVAATVPGPWFVKPANMGSSVGVRKVKRPADLAPALLFALQYDRRAIVEAGVEQVRELEVAVLGNDRPAASVLGEVEYEAEFYDYETKYTAGRAKTVIPAHVPDDVADRCRQMAIQTFLALDCAGLARVDFFYQPSTGRLYVNEVNTMPGFTPFSMYPTMWQASGKEIAPLLDALLQLALERGQPHAAATPG